MSVSTRRKLKSEICCGSQLDDADEGTAARTRPLSYEEIMVKRKNKKDLDNSREEAGEAEWTKCEEAGRSSKHDSRGANSHATKYSQDHAQEAGTGRTGDKTSKIEESHGISRDKESRHVDSRSNLNHEKHLKSSSETVKDSRVSARRRQDEHLRDNAVLSFNKSHHEDSVLHDRYIERSTRDSVRENKRNDRGGVDDKHRDRDSVRENKRKDRGVVDDKHRDSGSLKKHDSGSNRYSEIREWKEKKPDDGGRLDSDIYEKKETKYNSDNRRVTISDRNENKHESGSRPDVDISERKDKKQEKRTMRDSDIFESKEKKHESGSRRDIEIPERKEKKLESSSRREYDLSERKERKLESGRDSDINENKEKKHETSRRNSDISDRIEKKHESGSRRDSGIYENKEKKHETSGRNSDISDRIEKKHESGSRRDSGIYESKEKKYEGGGSRQDTDFPERKEKKHVSGSRRDSDIGNSKEKKHESGSRQDSDLLEREKKHESGSKRVSDIYESKEKKRESGSKQNSDLPEKKDKNYGSGSRQDLSNAEIKERKVEGRSVQDLQNSERKEKKNDSGSRQNSDIYERKEKLDLPQSHHEATRPKRRRSRSQEHGKDKGRRSRSISPKARKTVPSRGHDHGESSYHSQRDRSRQHCDGDANKMSGNTSTSTGYHRRHGASSSGLGGYSPRKRKNEGAVSTPSPPIRSPERKTAGWDLPPTGSNGNLGSAVASGLQGLSQIKSWNMIELAAGNSVPSMMGKPLSILSSNLSSFKEGSIDSVQLTQATRPKRSLYIDNVTSSISDKDIMERINNLLLSSGANHIRGTRPCISCVVNKEKGQALVEFLTPEDASVALSLDGRSLFGNHVKIRRPKDFVEVTNGPSERPKTTASAVRPSERPKTGANTISDIVEDTPNKIFIGGLPEELSSEMIREIVSAFGSLKAYHFETNEGLNGSCAFLEYADESVTLKACAGLNGMKLGGRVLTVTQAIPVTQSAVHESSGSKPCYGIPEHVKSLLELPTPVLKLCNVLEEMEMKLLSEIDFVELLEDIRIECSRFGSVLSINVVKPSSEHSDPSEARDCTDDILPSQRLEFSEPHMISDSAEAGIQHHDEAHNVVEPSSWAEEVATENIVVAEDEQHLSQLPSASIEEVKDTDKVLLENCDVEAGGSPDLAVVDGSNIQEEETNEKLSIQENEVKCNDEDITKENQDGVILGPENVSGVKKASAKRQDFNQISGSAESAEDQIPSVEHVADVELNNAKQQEAFSPSADEIECANSGTDASAVKDEMNRDIWESFEVGTVFVEFRRAEASCMAAHALHGRLFDNRIVSVGYVPLDVYRARFPK